MTPGLRGVQMDAPPQRCPRPTPQNLGMCYLRGKETCRYAAGRELKTGG